MARVRVEGIGMAGVVHSRPVAAVSTYPAAAATHPRTSGHADVDAQRRGHETHLSEKYWEKKVDLEKDWDTRSASDGDSSSTETLRPMPSAVVR